MSAAPESTRRKISPTASTPTDEGWLPHTATANFFGISTRTLDRWVQAGIVERPLKINGRKYHRKQAIGQDRLP